MGNPQVSTYNRSSPKYITSNRVPDISVCNLLFLATTEPTVEGYYIEDKGEKLVLETPILWGDIEEDDTDPLSDSKCKAEVTDNPEFEDPLRIF